MIRRKEEPGLKQVRMEEKGGWGVIAERKFLKGMYVCEYSGDLISKAEAARREKMYTEVSFICLFFKNKYNARKRKWKKKRKKKRTKRRKNKQKKKFECQEHWCRRRLHTFFVYL